MNEFIPLVVLITLLLASWGVTEIALRILRHRNERKAFSWVSRRSRGTPQDKGLLAGLRSLQRAGEVVWDDKEDRWKMWGPAMEAAHRHKHQDPPPVTMVREPEKKSSKRLKVSTPTARPKAVRQYPFT